MSFSNPKDIVEAYKNGLPGAYYDEKEFEDLMSSLRHPYFGAAAGNLSNSGVGKRALLYKAVQKFDPGFGTQENQKTGDCTSHGTRNAVDATRAVEIINGDAESFVARGATEAIYGDRGHSGQGMSVYRAAQFVTTKGGIILRKKYDFADFSKYNASIGMGWGRRGVPREVLLEGNKNQVQTSSLIKSVAEARDAIYNGYALSVGSNVGFSNKRNKYGVSDPSGSWAHCMCWAGMDDTREFYDETLFLIINSWGEWNGGPRVFDQPVGSFWIRESVADRMIRQDQTFAFSNVDGFEAKDLDWSSIDEVF